MNIRLGTFLFGDDDNYVTASIEPVKPAFRESIGRVVDGGRLRVQTIDAEPEGPAFKLFGLGDQGRRGYRRRRGPCR